MSIQPSDVARREHAYFPLHHYKPGQALPPSHIRVDALETLQRHANRWEADTRAGRPTVENPNPPIVRTFPQRQRAATTTAQSGKKVAA